MKHRFREPGSASREPLAVSQTADIFSLFFAEAITENEGINGACVVTIRGPIEHHDCGYGESYEGIRKRFGEALASDYPSVILRIDSPGGVVSGLNQAVYDMRRAKKAIGKPVYVYVDEMACSAAYALATVGDEIIIPPSGIAGSVGVISLMYDQTGLDKKAGLNFETITSGVRKADGHPHVALSSEAIAAEKERVDKLAGQFFRIVEKSRGISADQVQSYQAAIFMGTDAVAAGLADDVSGWEGLIGSIAEVHGASPQKKSAPVNKKTVAKNTPYGSTCTRVTVDPKPGATMLRMKALIAQTKKALVTEGDVKKRAALVAQLATYEATAEALKKTKIKYSEESEESGEEDDEEESEEGGNETDRTEDDMPGDKKKPGDDDDDGDEDDEEDEEEEESSEKKMEDEGGDAEAIAALRKLAAKSGGKVSAALANLLSERDVNKKLAGRIAAIEKRNAKSEKNTRIDAHLERRLITKAEASELRAKPLAFVRDYLGMRKTAIVRAPSEKLAPDFDFNGDVENGYGDQGGASAHFSTEEAEQNERMIADIVAKSGGKVTREMVIRDFKKRLSAMNGVTKGRY